MKIKNELEAESEHSPDEELENQAKNVGGDMYVC